MKKKLLILALLALAFAAVFAVGVHAAEGDTYPMGDANMDGTVNTRDAVLIKQSIVSMTELTDEQKYYADVYDDGTGAVNTRDVVLILQHIVGMDVELDTRATITFVTNGGSAVSPITEKRGAAITAPASPTKTDYTFLGWYTDAACTNAYTFTTMPEEDLTLYAGWRLNRYTISFSTNGGSAVAPISQICGTVVTAPAAPTKTGYTFAGWYTDAACTRAYSFTTMPRENVTLYAKWSVNRYTISFNANGGSTVAPITQNYGTDVTAPEAPERTGYTFGGWYTDAACTRAYRFSTMPAENITLYAKWNGRYTISFNSTGGSAVPPISQNYNTPLTQPTDPTKTGYTFGGWYTDAACTQAYIFILMPSENVTLYAKWYINQYTISFNANGGSAVPSITQNYGTPITAPSMPLKMGHAFGGWYTDADCTQIFTFATMPGTNMTLYAKWVAGGYTISFESNGGSSVPPIAQNYGTAITAPTDPSKTGYTFGGWYADVTCTRVYIFNKMPAENLTLYAKWNVNRYTIDFYENGGSAVTAITQNYGTAVTAPTAPTKTGYTFDGWYTDEACTCVYSFSTMPAENVTLYAKWNVNHYTISFDVNGGSAVSPITQNYNTVVTRPTDPTKTGHIFGGWYIDVACTRAYNFSTMPAENITLYAKWNQVTTFVVTFCDEDGSIIETVIVERGDDATPPIPPEKSGFRFVGWDGTYTNIRHDVTIKAKYVRCVTVTFLDADGFVLDLQMIDYGTAAERPENPTKSNHRFVGWDRALTNVTENIIVKPVFVRQYTVDFVDYNGALLKRQAVDSGSDATPPVDPSLTGYRFAGWQGVYTNVLSDMTVTAKYEINTYTVRFKLPDGTLLARYLCERCDTYRAGDELEKEKCPVCGERVLSVTEQTVAHGFSAIAPDYPLVYADGTGTTAQVYKFTRWNCNYGSITGDTDVMAVYETVCDTPVVSVEYDRNKAYVYVYAPEDMSLFGLELAIGYPTDEGVLMDDLTCNGLFYVDAKQYVINNNTGSFTYVWRTSQENGNRLLAGTRVVALEFSATASYDTVFVTDCVLVAGDVSGNNLSKVTPIIIYR